MNLAKILSTINGVVGLYINIQHPDRFLVGYPNLFHDGVIVYLVSQSGEADGIAYCALENIYCVEWESEYLHQFQQEKKSYEITFDVSCSGYNAFLRYAQENQLLVQFMNPTSQRSQFGFIQSYSEKTISIERIFLNGTTRKNIHLSRNKFTFMCINSETEKDLMKLYLEVKKDEQPRV